MASRKVVYRRPLAIDDVTSHSEAISAYSLESAFRFLDALESTLDLLSRFPEAGGVIPVRRKELEGIRAKLVVGFSHFIILYCVEENHIEILRVIRGGQDLHSVSLNAR
ncbi:MAG: type II toxin-antitoxin system RelE/ParE family toxin [Pirellula sp.]|jgi:plasmid stabilization system protein ParE